MGGVAAMLLMSGAEAQLEASSFGQPLTVAPSSLPNTYYYTARPVVAPRDGANVSLNPPALNWPGAGESRLTYDVELCSNSEFSGGDLLRREGIGYTVFTFSKQLAPGTWYWRYAVNADGKKTWSDIHHFVVDEKTPVFVPPSSEQVIANLNRNHPIVLSYGVAQDKVIEHANSFPKIKESVIADADRILNTKIIDFDHFDHSQMTARNYGRLKAKQLRLLRPLAKAYLLTKDEKYCQNAILRIEEAWQWKDLNYQSDMMYADFIRYLGEAYDTYQDALPSAFRESMLEQISEFLDHQYQKWSGKVENRHLDNHFWQVEISGYFYNAVATLSALPENKKYIDHAYQIFLARAPVAGGNGGGWANGLPYFAVNTSTVGDMAYFLQVVGGAPLFQKPWYQKLPDYYIQCGPAGAPTDGFGDMHDRVSQKGQGSVLPYLVMADSNPKALWQLNNIDQGSSLGDERRGNAEIQWLMLLTNTQKLSSKQAFSEDDLPEAMLFPEVGLVSMHTGVANPPEDTAVYFRSSPFGAFGHMHANQNAFNLVHKADKLFYSAGYYTSFADPHSVTSYRHTRAHNSMLINHRGQAFGHQGYGFIKRYAGNSKITYTCGEAAKAYRPMEDEMWLGIVNHTYAEAGIDPLADFGDAKLNSYERHIAFLRPNVLVVYDVIDAKDPVSAQFLLNSPHLVNQNDDHTIQLKTEKSAAEAHIFCSSPANISINDDDFITPVDHLQKYAKDALKKQYHFSYETSEKSSQIRFLCIIGIGDSEKDLEALAYTRMDNGVIQLGEYTIQAELDTTQPPSLHVLAEGEELHVNEIPDVVLGESVIKVKGSVSLLSEKRNGLNVHVSTADTAPNISE